MLTFPRCILCLKPLRPAEVATEHVFPEAIGGVLTVEALCRPCNSLLGHEVDDLLVNHWLIRAKRMLLGLAGKGGDVPNVFSHAVLASDPEQQVHYRPRIRGRPRSLLLVPLVRTERLGDGSLRIEVSLDPRDRSRLPDIVNKVLRRHGMKERTAEEIEALVQTHCIQQPGLRSGFSASFVDFKIGLVKVAYEIACYFLGDAYLDDPVAEQLRAALRAHPATSAQWEGLPLAGTASILSEEGRAGLRGSGIADHHEAALVRRGGVLACHVRVFDLFGAMVVVSRTPERYGGHETRHLLIDVKSRSQEQDEFGPVLRLDSRGGGGYAQGGTTLSAAPESSQDEGCTA